MGNPGIFVAVGLSTGIWKRPLTPCPWQRTATVCLLSYDPRADAATFIDACLANARRATNGSPVFRSFGRESPIIGNVDINRPRRADSSRPDKRPVRDHQTPALIG